jgi:hypothetical protein
VENNYFATLASIKGLQNSGENLNSKFWLVLVNFCSNSVADTHSPPPAMLQAVVHMLLEQLTCGLGAKVDKKGPCPPSTRSILGSLLAISDKRYERRNGATLTAPLPPAIVVPKGLNMPAPLLPLHFSFSPCWEPAIKDYLYCLHM